MLMGGKSLRGFSHWLYFGTLNDAEWVTKLRFASLGFARRSHFAPCPSLRLQALTSEWWQLAKNSRISNSIDSFGREKAHDTAASVGRR